VETLPWRLLLEQLRSPTEIARILPPGRGGRPVHPQTVVGWIIRGIMLPDGSRLHLEGVRCSSRWFTSLEAVARFLDRQTPNSHGSSEPALGRQTTSSNQPGQETKSGS